MKSHEDFGEAGHVLEKDMDLVRTTSYMVYAHTASAIHEHNREKAKEIILNLSNRMEQAGNFEELTQSIHALGNAGEAVPLTVIQNIVDNEEVPLSIKVHAINGLSKRISDKTEEETTDYIHTLVSDHPEESVKLAALHVQLERERKSNRSIC